MRGNNDHIVLARRKQATQRCAVDAVARPGVATDAIIKQRLGQFKLPVRSVDICSGNRANHRTVRCHLDDKRRVRRAIALHIHFGAQCALGDGILLNRRTNGSYCGDRAGPCAVFSGKRARHIKTGVRTIGIHDVFNLTVRPKRLVDQRIGGRVFAAIGCGEFIANLAAVGIVAPVRIKRELAIGLGEHWCFEFKLRARCQRIDLIHRKGRLQRSAGSGLRLYRSGA